MNIPIAFEEKTIKRKVDKNSKFILIGNKIDGFLDFRFNEFKNYIEVKEKLFDILVNIECSGEWDIKLYQVRDNYKITYKYGYYKTPDRGKLIYTYSYMDNFIKQITFKNDMIIFFHTYIDYYEDWLSEAEDFHNYNLDISILKIKII